MERKLERNQHDKMVAGVASGLADYLELDVTLVRMLFVLAFIFGLSGLLIYVVMWIAVPKRPVFQVSSSALEADYRIKEELFLATKKKSSSGRLIPGLILIGIGVYFLLAEFDILPNWFSIFKLWPVMLIIAGITILVRSGTKSSQNHLADPKAQQTTEPSTISSANKPEDQPLV